VEIFGIISKKPHSLFEREAIGEDSGILINYYKIITINTTHPRPPPRLERRQK